MRVPWWSVPCLCVAVVAMLCQRAAADVRIAVGIYGTDRSYDGTGDQYAGFGPGVGLDLLKHDRDAPIAIGVHIGWHIYDQDEHNQQAYARITLLQLHGFVERRFSFGAIGMGIGLDSYSADNYSVDGTFSYEDHHTLLSVNAQLVFDVARTRAGVIGVVTGVGVFPILDVAGLLSGGEGGVNWHGVTASLGVSTRF